MFETSEESWSHKFKHEHFVVIVNMRVGMIYVNRVGVGNVVRINLNYAPYSLDDYFKLIGDLTKEDESLYLKSK